MGSSSCICCIGRSGRDFKVKLSNNMNVLTNYEEIFHIFKKSVQELDTTLLLTGIGVIVILVGVVILIKYFKTKKTKLVESASTVTSSETSKVEKRDTKTQKASSKAFAIDKKIEKKEEPIKTRGFQKEEKKFEHIKKNVTSAIKTSPVLDTSKNTAKQLKEIKSKDDFKEKDQIITKNIQEVEIRKESKKDAAPVIDRKTPDNNNIQRPLVPIKKRVIERDEEQEARDFQKELEETERKAEEEAKSFMRPIQLNIDKNARSKDEALKSKEKEMVLVKKLCGEAREIAKAANPEEREERRKEMEKVRSARSYFKTVDKYRSESASAVPRMRLRQDEEFQDSVSRGSSLRLSQFEPGKINKKLTSKFENDSEQNETFAKPPTKKLITLDQILNKESVQNDEIINIERELREIKDIRKSWVPPESPIKINKSTEDVPKV